MKGSRLARAAALGRVGALLEQQAKLTPVFTQEGPQFYSAAYARNERFAKPGPYRTVLPPAQEAMFREWVARNRIPFNPDAKLADYDMRGFWLSRQQPGAPGRAANGHFPDTFKTPYDTSFSNESKFSAPNNPLAWEGNNLVNKGTGQRVFGSPLAAAALQPKIALAATKFSFLHQAGY